MSLTIFDKKKREEKNTKKIVLLMVYSLSAERKAMLNE